MNIYNKLFLVFLAVLTNPVIQAASMEQTGKNATVKLITVAASFGALFSGVVGWRYWTGDQRASEGALNLIKGCFFIFGGTALVGSLKIAFS
jgi:hypothetical protein